MQVTVRPRDSVGSTRSDRVVELRGSTAAVAAAYEAIMFKVEAEAKTLDPNTIPANGETMVPLKVSGDHCNVVCGLFRLQNRSGLMTICQTRVNGYLHL